MIRGRTGGGEGEEWEGENEEECEVTALLAVDSSEWNVKCCHTFFVALNVSGVGLKKPFTFNLLQDSLEYISMLEHTLYTAGDRREASNLRQSSTCTSLFIASVHACCKHRGREWPTAAALTLTTVVRYSKDSVATGQPKSFQSVQTYIQAMQRWKSIGSRTYST